MTHDSLQETDSSYRRIVWLIIAGGLLLRVALALFTDNLSHPDENFQIFEQAHRVVFGYGLIPWEFRFSVRSWLTPGLVAGLLYPFKLLGFDNPNLYIPAIRIILGLFSLWLVYSAYQLGRKIAGARAGLYAAFFCAFWYEIAYFSIRPLSEVWATTFFIAALAISYQEKNIFRHILAAFLVVMTAALRIHYLPLLIIYFIYIIHRPELKTRGAVVASFIATVIGVGLLERATSGNFFTSYMNYIEMNRNFSFGGNLTPKFSPELILSLGYSSLFLHWILLLAGFIFLRKSLYLPLSAAIVLLVHSFVPLKEHLVSIRFIYLVIPALMITAGVLAENLMKRPGLLSRSGIPRITLILIFIGISATGLWGHLSFQQRVYPDGILGRNPSLQAYRYLSRSSNVSGVYDISEFWFQSGGYFYLHKNVPLYFESHPPASENYFTHVIAEGDLPTTSGLRLLKSYGTIKIYEWSDPDFQYQKDHNYTSHMYQPGIDDHIP
jgi:hypothetical protein